MVELTTSEQALLDAYLAPFIAVASDRRAATLLGATIRGILASESLLCSRIAAFSPQLATSRHSERRMRRMLNGETTTRSELDPDELVARLQARGVERLQAEDAI